MGYPVCVICKVNLDNPAYHVFTCPRCKRQYILDYEVLSYSEDVGSVYDDISNIEAAGLDAGGPGLSTASPESEDFPSLDEQYEEKFNKGKIKIPDYLKRADELQEE